VKNSENTLELLVLVVREREEEGEKEEVSLVRSVLREWSVLRRMSLCESSGKQRQVSYFPSRTR
jgi:hypothetical protein